MAKANPLFNPDEWPAMNVVLTDTEALIPLAQNARYHSDAQVDEIVVSLKEFTWALPILIDVNGTIIAGHGRIKAAKKIGFPQVPTAVAKGWSDEMKRKYALLDNMIYESGDWDQEARYVEYHALQDEGADFSAYDFDIYRPEEEDLETDGPVIKGSLADRFGVPPFSILNAREGWWQNRKRAWIALGIESEAGRGENLLKFSDSIALDGKAYNERFSGKGKKKKKPNTTAVGTQDWVKKKIKNGDIEGGMSSGQSGTSIFDPVLCELCYSWFSAPDARVLDPFAGGSVRGIVAGYLGREYVGIDLSEHQIEANLVQREAIREKHGLKASPAWHHGDSLDMANILPKDFTADFLFSCPPYADLEVYSEDERDISNMDYDNFLKIYREIIRRACDRLADNSFAVFVTGDARDRNGNYYGLPEHTNQAFVDAGLAKYNEAILVTAIGSLPIRITKQFNASRKMGKTHQNVQIFLKGDAKKAMKKLSGPEFAPIETEFDETGGFEIDE